MTNSFQSLRGTRFILNLLSLGILIGSFAIPAVVLSQAPTEYELLAPIPLGEGADVTERTNSFDYIPGLVRLTIAVAAVLAVLRIMIAGIQYMSSDAWSGKSEAKNAFNEALWGLGLAIGAWLILNTINPRLVNFNLNIDRAEIEAPEGSESGGGTGGGGGTVGCRGDCPHSYQNGDTTITYRDCVSCSPANSFGLNIKHSSPGGVRAQINTELGNKLKALKDGGAPGFRVSETWPPTSLHSNQKQYDGTSVDVALLAPSPQAIKEFIDKASAVGLNVIYEVKTQDDENNLVKAGIPADKILPVPRITAPHFSVE